MPPVPPMTPVRRMVLAAGLPLVLILITLAGYTWVKRTVIYLASQSQVGYSVGFSAPAAGGYARVHSGNASLTVRAGPGRRILVRGHFSSSFARPGFSHRLGPEGLRLDPQCRIPAGTCSLGLAITVPAGLPVSVSNSFGTLHAQGLHGTVALWDNTGDLTASRLTGNVHLTDSFGTISVTGLAAADVVASDNTGDISLTFTTVPRQVSVTDSFGSVTLVLPPGPAAYQVQTRNSFGSTTVSVPRSPSAANVIKVSNNSGDITIVTGKRPAVTHAHPGPPSPPAQPGPDQGMATSRVARTARFTMRAYT